MVREAAGVSMAETSAHESRFEMQMKSLRVLCYILVVQKRSGVYGKKVKLVCCCCCAAADCQTWPVCKSEQQRRDGQCCLATEQPISNKRQSPPFGRLICCDCRPATIQQSDTDAALTPLLLPFH